MLLFEYKERDFRLQGGVICVTFVLQWGVFFLFFQEKRKNQRKVQGLLFSPTRFLHYAKGQKLATLKQSALLNASLRALA